jgi:hypothetical protein
VNSIKLLDASSFKKRYSAGFTLSDVQCFRVTSVLSKHFRDNFFSHLNKNCSFQDNQIVALPSACTVS